MSQKPRFKLYYWPEFPGRGELMRLLFAETETPYDDVFRDLSFEDAKAFCYGSSKFFAVPAIEDNENGDLCISQTCVIMRYLAERCDGGRLYPKGNDGYKAEVLMQDAADLLAEGCSAWHAIDYNKGYSEQAEATRPFIEYFVNNRLPKWLNRFNTVLERNNPKVDENGQSQGVHLVGTSLSYADLAVFQVLDGIRSETGSADGICASAYHTLTEDKPLIVEFMRQIENRPNIKRWRESPHHCNFTQTGPGF